MSFIEWAVQASVFIIGLSILIIFLRLVIGPGIEDRIVALDLLSANAIAFIAVYSIQKNTTTFLDVGIIVALLAFLGTVAFGYYLGRRQKHD
ncbi:MAG: monovalent cation/H+ antiporter complex subunit F [Chlorobium sp.]|uniref:Multiple resistance and pH regulation protein F n=1 Tax=Chlorobium phaeobacteroides (strain BS1) TaxID=331678 RepID=B3EJZ4_CHLPB|nr:cation:proton antiporter [Chlorobium phaeobacteroides]MCW8795874.1 monovalent cation/H+ antiporter complex subunit F [Chlorobium sp.]MCW8819848.1 monovalent cation/H+ antiporter complex subunit F [Ignavibacteriaceae bacterium]NEX13654.1 cation:proton antiporter [Prosthecochloris sp.]MBL6956140.1 cation:proton antiporter [Chlorobium phaeobacteroides]